MLLNSIPRSLLILTIWFPFSTWILVQRTFKCSIVLDFYVKKDTNENLEKSSTTTRTYLFLPLFSMRIGPMKSIWKRSKGLVVLIPSILLFELFTCLPFMHLPQIDLGWPLYLGIPPTPSLFTMWTKSLLLIWPNLLYHSLMASSLALLHIKEVLELELIALQLSTVLC